MVRPEIAGVEFPSTMGKGGGGQITVHWQQERLAGDGTVYKFGEQWIEWDWEVLEPEEFDWLMTKYEASPTTFKLWEDDTRRNLLTFTSGSMLEPKYESTYGNVYYANVHVEFRALAPLRS